MKARAPSAMNAPCWLKSSKKFPSRGSSLPNSIVFPLAGTAAVYERSQTGDRRFGASATIAATPGVLYRGEHSMDHQQTASAGDASDTVLVVRDLQCRRGERVLFAPISFVVRSGAIVWIRGANGQGKTTLL